MGRLLLVLVREHVVMVYTIQRELLEEKQRPRPVNKNEDAKLKALLNEVLCQTQQELADSLGVTHRIKLKEVEHWVSYELKPRNMEAPFFTRSFNCKKGTAFGFV